MLVKKSVIWLNMPRISFGPALLKLLRRSAPPPRLVLNSTCGLAGPELAPKGVGMVILSVAVARVVPPIFTPSLTSAVMLMISGLGRKDAVTWTLEGRSSDRSSLLFESRSFGVSVIDPVMSIGDASVIEASSRLRLTVAVIAGMLSLKLVLRLTPGTR